VSGQLNGEYYACALSNVYTFGPTFRAENSHTTRHLAEFWMIEPEMAFCALEDDMQCAEDYVRACCRHVLAACPADLKFLEERCATLRTATQRCLQAVGAPTLCSSIHGEAWCSAHWRHTM
jgi:asparaginyl-tRNA synthetase